MNVDTQPQRPSEIARSTSPFRSAARIAGIAAITLAIYKVATLGAPGGAAYGSVMDYVREIGFLVYLAASILAILASVRTGLAGPVGPRLVAAGYALITIGVVIGLVVREELDWFFVLAGPGLLLSGVGFVVFAVGIWRRSSLPRWAAVLAGVGGVLAVVMAEFGTGVLIGSFWLFAAAGLPATTRPPGRSQS